VAYYITLTKGKANVRPTERVESFADVMDHINQLSKHSLWVEETVGKAAATLMLLREADLTDQYQDNEIWLWDRNGKCTDYVLTIEGSPHTP